MNKKLLLSIPLSIIIFLLASLQSGHSAHAQTSCPNIPTSGDSVTTTFTVSEDNAYTIWSRVIAPNTSSNSYFLQIDNGCAFNVGDSAAIPANQFTWVNYQDG